MMTLVGVALVRTNARTDQRHGADVTGCSTTPDFMADERA